MKTRFTAALNGSVLPPELLHIVTLTQEVSLTHNTVFKLLILVLGTSYLRC